MQRTAGNRAVTQLLQNLDAVTVSREADVAAPTSPYGALDDPSFNADTIAHDLLRAIDQKEHSYVGDVYGHEDPTKERRKVDVPMVIAALENRTASQIAEVERRYLQFEKRPLHVDLFEGGESDRQSSLTPDQRERIKVLLRGTKGEPIPERVLEELKKYPPAVAAQFRTLLLEKGNAAGSLRQLEADTIELHELLADKLDDAKRERVMALHRRPPKEFDAIDAFYTQHYGVGQLTSDLNTRLEGLQRMRVTALRLGNWPQADAYAIEDKRRSIEELNKQEQADSGLAGALASTSPMASYMREQRKQKKEELTGDIEAIIEMNRREALADPANASKTSGAAVAERLNKILGQQTGEAGTLGSDLTRTLGHEHAAAITAAADLWNTAGSASLVESAASELAAMEKAGTTKAIKIMDMLRSFRELAKHDLLARVRDPAVPPAEKQAIGANVESAVTGLAQKYIDGFRDAYNRQRGDGRTYQQIIESASDADKTFLEDLRYGGGETSDLAELQHAMAKEDVDKVKDILRRQRDREAIDKLVAAYNGLGGGRDLRKELFGTALTGEQVSVEGAEAFERRNLTHGLVTGRDAAQVAEQLAKPTAEELSGKATRGLFGIPVAPGLAEVAWITGSGEREYDVTMLHRGATGKLREIGGDPETERLLLASNEKLQNLRAEWAAEKDPAKKQHLLLEMRKTRATLSGDADAYEKDNERVLGEIRGALSFAVSIALAVAIPGAGAGLAAFIETTAVNIAANVAANVVIKGGDYGLDDLKGDVLGGVLGAAGGKFGDEVLGRVAAKIARPAADATIGAAGKVGIETALAKEAAGLATTGEKAVIAAEDFEAKEAGREAATILTPEGEAAVTGATKQAGAIAGDAGGAGAATAAKAGAERTLFEKASRELGGFFGGLYGGKLPSGDLSLSVDEVVKALFVTGVGKAAHHQTAGAAAPEERATGEPAASEGAPSEHEPTPEPTERTEPEPAVSASAFEAMPTSADAFGPRSPTEMLADNGIPMESAKGFQELANEHDLVIKVRPTNRASLPVLEAGGLAKAEIVKAKTLNRADMLIGGPIGHEGKVGFFEPKMPSQEILDVLSPEAHKEVTDRFNQRLEEFGHYKDEYARLAAEGMVRITDGVLQIADPRAAATGDAPHGKFKDVGGDHDVYDIRRSNGEQLNASERAFVIAQLRSMEINVEHGYHMAWEQDSPQTYSAEADAKIREQHREREPLVAFVPKSTPREVFADTEVRGPERVVGPDDPHHPLKDMKVVEPTDVPESNAPGTGGPGEVQIPGETDFGDIMPRRRDSPPGAPGGAASGADDFDFEEPTKEMPARTPEYDDSVKVRSEYGEERYDRGQANPFVPAGSYRGEARYDARRVVEGDVAFKEITVKVHLDPGQGVTNADLAAIRADATFGVESIYNDPKHELMDGDVLRVRIEFTDDRMEAHTIIDVQRHSPLKSAAENRANQTRWFIGDDPIIHAHEVGHHLGLSDEYVESSSEAFPATGRDRPDAPNVRNDRGVMGNFFRDSGGGPFVDPGTRVQERHLTEISETIAEQKLRDQLESRPGFDPTPGKTDQSSIMPGDFDGFGPNGELQLTPTNVTESNLPALEQRLMMLRYQAMRLGVPAEAVFDVTTPNMALRLARHILGDERVHVR